MGQGVMARLSSLDLDHCLKMNGYWNYHFCLGCCKLLHLSLLVWIGPKRTAYKMGIYILTEKIMLSLFCHSEERLKNLALGKRCICWL